MLFCKAEMCFQARSVDRILTDRNVADKMKKKKRRRETLQKGSSKHAGKTWKRSATNLAPVFSFGRRRAAFDDDDSAEAVLMSLTLTPFALETLKKAQMPTLLR